MINAAMFKHIGLGFLLVTGVPLWAQTVPDAYGDPGSGPDDEYQMSMPTQVSGAAYSMHVGPGVRSNTLSGGVIVTTAYDDNIFAGGSTAPVSATSFNVGPNIGFSLTTPRQTTSFGYGAGFSFYVPNNSLNQVTQNASLSFQYRPTRHSSLSVQDSFQQNSSLYNQPYIFGGVPVSGSTENQQSGIILPYGGQIVNNTSLQYSYQFSRDSMVGGGGSYGLYHYSNTHSTGLNNSNGGGVDGFYSRRLSKEHYLGVMYQFSGILTNPIRTTTHVQTGSVFYTFVPSRRFSLSLNAGPEYFDTQEDLQPKESSLGSFVLASFNWSGTRSGVAATYSHAVTAGQGLLGAYNSDNFNVSWRWQFERYWSTGVSGAYSNLTNSIAVASSTTPGGHTLFGTVFVAHQIRERLNVEADYRRLHQNYSGIQALSNSSDDDRVSVSLNYQFTRPVGR
jgi:hypothetical protein